MKKRISSALFWFVDHMAGTYLSLMLLGFGTAFAATTYTVYNVPDMFLYAGINTTETTNIRMTGPIRNGIVVSYPALTGGVIELRQGSKVEHIYYSQATVDSTTKIITLTGSVIRDLCWNTATTYVGCSAGQSFQRGAQARLVDDHRLFNLGMKLDVANVTTGSGSYRCGATSQPCIFPSATTTAQKNSFTYGASAGLYPLNFDTTLGVMQYWNGSAWISFGSGSTINATETVRGAVELADFTEVANRTLTGATNALVVLTPRHLVKQGTATGATAANLIPLLNASGRIPIALGGTGTGGLVASGAIMVLQGAYNSPRPIYATSANQVITTTDGRNWVAGAVPADINILTGSIANSNTLTNPQSVVRFTQTGALSSAHLNVKGNMFEVFAAGDSGWGAGAMTVTLFVGDTNVGNCAFTPTATGQAWSVIFRGTTRTAGASGVMQVNSLGSMGSGTNQKACSAGTTTSSYDFTSNKVVNIGISFSASNGTNAATMQQFQVESRAP